MYLCTNIKVLLLLLLSVVCLSQTQRKMCVQIRDDTYCEPLSPRYDLCRIDYELKSSVDEVFLVCACKRTK